MTQNEISILRELRADLAAKLAALDAALLICEGLPDTPDTCDVYHGEETTGKPARRVTEGGACFTSAIDLDKIPGLNRKGGGVRTG